MLPVSLPSISPNSKASHSLKRKQVIVSSISSESETPFLDAVVRMQTSSPYCNGVDKIARLEQKRLENSKARNENILKELDTFRFKLIRRIISEDTGKGGKRKGCTVKPSFGDDAQAQYETTVKQLKKIQGDFSSCRVDDKKMFNALQQDVLSLCQQCAVLNDQHSYDEELFDACFRFTMFKVKEQMDQDEFWKEQDSKADEAEGPTDHKVEA